MSFKFDVERAAQLVAYFIQKTGRARMNIMKLLKLLYIADRNSLKSAGYPLTGDEPFALEHGPVPTAIYDLLKEKHLSAHHDRHQFWSRFFKKEGYYVHLLVYPGNSKLSEHDEKVMDELWQTHGARSQYELEEITHRFDEWKNNEPGQSSQPIPLCDILTAIGRPDAIESIEQTKREDRHFAALFGN